MAKEILLTAKQIDKIVTKVANELNKDLKKSKSIPVFIGVLKGCAPFMQDLVMKCKFDLVTDYIQVSSYSGTSSTGVISLKKDLSENIEGRDIYLVEDIIDTGYTLNYLRDYIKIHYKPRSIKIVCFIDKKPMRKVDLHADYVGLDMEEDKFVVGYGLDYNELSRNVKKLFVPDENELKKWDRKLKK